MIVTLPVQFLGIQNLFHELKCAFPDCTLRMIGAGTNQSILVKKSVWVAVQITVRQKDVFIDGTFSNFFVAGLMTLLTLGHLTSFGGWFTLEKRVATYLHGKC